MQIARSEQGGAVVIAVSGVVDHTTSEEFRIQLLGRVEEALAVGRPIVIDLAELKFIVSSGLRVLILASRSCKARNIKLGIASVNSVVQEVFTISRVNLFIPIYADVPEAVGKVTA